jgi:S-phase kinase-associated protein 1
MVTLLSNDGAEFEVLVDVAKMSETIRNLMEDAGIEQAIPLPNVNGDVLKSVIDYCTYHYEHPQAISADAEKVQDAERRTDDIIPWDLDFCKVTHDRLFQYILAANYLDIKPFLDLGCKTVANMIKGKTPEEIRKTFGIKDDFTPEEEEQVRRENEWCEER